MKGDREFAVCLIACLYQYKKLLLYIVLLTMAYFRSYINLQVKKEFCLKRRCSKEKKKQFKGQVSQFFFILENHSAQFSGQENAKSSAIDQLLTK